MKYDVFISCKSEDYRYAKNVYDYLCGCGYNVFFAESELRIKSRDDYGEVIDDALEKSEHMIVFASKVEHVMATYVKSEWRTFVEEKRSGRKCGNIITILKNTEVSKLPIALRNLQSIDYSSYKDIVDFLPKSEVRLNVKSTNNQLNKDKIFGTSENNNGVKSSENGAMSLKTTRKEWALIILSFILSISMISIIFIPIIVFLVLKLRKYKEQNDTKNYKKYMKYIIIINILLFVLLLVNISILLYS